MARIAGINIPLNKRVEVGLTYIYGIGRPSANEMLSELGLVDELNLTIAPYLFGGADAPTLTGLSKEFLPASVHCVMTDMRVVGDECFLTYLIKSRP